MFPENIQVSVKVKGKKQKGVKLNLYGSRAKFNDLIATPYRTYETDKKGEYLITGYMIAPHLLCIPTNCLITAGSLSCSKPNIKGKKIRMASRI